MTRLILKFLLIFQTLKATFSRVQIELEGGAGWPWGQDGLFTKNWRNSINVLGRRREGRIQHLSTESETIHN